MLWVKDTGFNILNHQWSESERVHEKQMTIILMQLLMFS